MKTNQIILFSFALVALTSANPTSGPTVQPTPASQQVYQPQEYVPHQTYPNSETYPNSGTYDYLVPAGSLLYQPTQYMTSLLPGSKNAIQNALQTALSIFAKVGLFLMGGVALLIVGGIFTTAVCSLTPLCTITFNGMGSISKDTMRSYMTPDKISAAAGLVQDAIGKYQRLQRAVNNKEY